jgi:hypothetical protein
MTMIDVNACAEALLLLLAQRRAAAAGGWLEPHWRATWRAGCWRGDAAACSTRETMSGTVMDDAAAAHGFAPR